MWGRFSDRYGRRPALLIGLAASAIAYVIFAFASSLWLLFLSRLVQGAGGGTVGVIQAYVADSVRPEQRARGLGWLSAATNLGVTLGPVLGSAASLYGPHAPGLAAAALCVVNIAFAWKYLDESREVVDEGRHPQVPGRSRDAVAYVLKHTTDAAPRLIWIYAIAMGAFSGVTAILALFLAQRFGITPKTIGFFFMYIGLISVVTRLFILGWAVDRFGEARLSRFGAALLALGLGSLPFMHRMAIGPDLADRIASAIPSWAAVTHVDWIAAHVISIAPFIPLGLAVALIPLGTAFTFPCVTSLLSRVIPSHERGLYMGVQQTFGGVARVLFPALAGLAFDWILPVPFIVSAILVLGTIALSWGLETHASEPAREAA
jgi:MFS family permease